MNNELPDNPGSVASLGTDDLEWKDETPIAPRFDDVYFSVDDGLEESRFVFLDGVKVSELWEKDGHFTIGETGFGTGLNFLATWQRWQRDGCPGRFTFYSTEAWPLTLDALATAHAHFPELSDLAAELREVWPPATPGFHLRTFEQGKIRLILLFGDTADMLAEMDGAADAWYLDGFAPRKNSSMWRPEVLDQLARLSKPGTRLATFTAAGFVRRGLAERGFDVEKVPGFGRKRERIVASFAGKEPGPKQPWFARPAAMPPGRIAILGRGIAGTMLAFALAERGLAATIVSSSDRQCASRLKAAVLAPKFKAENSVQAAFAMNAWFHANQHGFLNRFALDSGGLHLVASPKLPQDRLNRMAGLIDWEERHLLQQADGSLIFPGGNAVDGEKLLSEELSCHQYVSENIAGIRRHSGVWELLDQAGECVVRSDTLFLATGWQGQLLQALEPLGLSGNRGQTSLIDGAAVSRLEVQENGLCFGGYLSPDTGDGNRQLGSSFDRSPGDNWKDARRADHDGLTALLSEATGVDCTGIEPIEMKAGVRANMYDHLPACGPVPDWATFSDAMTPLSANARQHIEFDNEYYQEGLFTLTGLGSRGYQYAPLLAEMLVADLVGEPCPVPRSLRRYLHPGRKVVRDIIRG